MSNLIVTQNCEKGISVNEIVVKDADKLRQLRDYLIDSGFTIKPCFDEKTIFDDQFSNFYYDKKNKLAYFRCITDCEYYSDGRLVDVYSENLVSHAFINVVSILSSLLGDLDSSNYESICSKTFIDRGVFKQGLFEDVWAASLRDIFDEMKKNDGCSKEYFYLKSAFDDGILQINSVKNFSREEVSQLRIFCGINLKELNSIYNNTLFVSDVISGSQGNVRVRK